MQESKLKSLELFANLSRTELRRLSSVTDEIVVPANTRLIGEGSFAYEFLLIISGSAAVYRDGELIAELGPGDFAGEIGAMRDVRRNATVLASSELTVIVMTARDLRQVAREMPSVGDRIEAAIAERSPATRGERLG
jgi:CRP/FNR family cyclic AMP-dependent transcriptional regulator